MSLRALGLGRFGPWRHLLVFFAGTLLIGAATAIHVHRDYELATSYWQERLQTVADDRAFIVSRYFQRRLQNVKAWAALPAFRALLAERTGSHDALLKPTHQTLDELLDALSSMYTYSGVFFINPQGQRLASTGDTKQLGPEALALCRAVVHDVTPQVGLLGISSGKPSFVFVAPVQPDTKGTDARLLPVVGVVAIFADPAADLFPALKAEPVATQTEEGLLIHREGSSAVLLSPLRKAPNSEFVEIIPAQNVNVLAQAAFEGHESVGAIADYRGVPIIAAVRPLSQAGWVLEEKVDSQEAYESFRRGAGMEASYAALLVFALAAGLVAHRRHHQAMKLLKQVEHHEDLLRAEKYAADIVDTVPAWMLVLTQDLRIQSANQAFLKYFDTRQEEIRGHALGDIMRTEGLLRQVDQAAKGQATVEEVLLDVKVRGKEIKLPARITLADLVQDARGKPEVLLIVEDLTESEHLRLATESKEKELREAEARYQTLAESSADFIGKHDLEGTILSVTPAVARRVGFKDPQQMVGFKVSDFLPRERRQEFDAYLETLRREGRAQGVMKAIALGGEEIMVEFKNSVLQEGPQTKVVLCVGRDITELVRMRKAFKKAKQFGANLEPTGMGGVVRLDTEGRFTFVNERAIQISGYAGGELIGRPFSALVSPEDVEPVDAIIRVSLTEGLHISGREVTIVRKDGHRRLVRLNLMCLVSGGASTGVVMAWKDLTALRAPPPRWPS
jgi:PAS domain S-box-containing protein